MVIEFARFMLLAAKSPDDTNPFGLYWAGAFLFGVYACLSKAQKKHADPICAASLACALGAFLISSILSLAAPALEKGSIAFHVGVLAVGGLLSICSVILAVVGLIRVASADAEVKAGKGMAIGGLVTAFLYVGLNAAFFLIGMHSSRNKEVQSLMVKEQPAEGVKLRFEPLNFMVQHPGKPWVQIDSKKLNVQAQVGLLKGDPQVFALFLAEELGVQSEFGVKDIVELAKSNLASVTTSREVVSEQEMDVNGIRGMHIRSKVKMQHLDLVYDQWLGLHNGFNYQVVCWGGWKDAQDVYASAEVIRKSFRQIDPARVSYGIETPMETYVSKDFGFRIKAEQAPKGWLKWRDFQKDVADAEIAVKHAQNGMFVCVIPIALDGQNPSLSELAQAYLKTWGFDAETMKGPSREVQIAGAKGLELDLERTLNGSKFLYRGRFAKRGSVGYMAMAWAVASEQSSKPDPLTEALNLVEIDAAEPSVRIDGLTQERRKASGQVLNYLGLEQYNAEQYEAAGKYFRAAYKSVREAQYLINALDALNRMQKYEEAFALLEQEGDPFKAQKEVRVWRAWLLSRVGRRAEAVAAYEKIFSEHLDLTADMVDFLGIAEEENKLDTAIEILARYRANKDSLDLQKRHAHLLEKKGDVNAAVELLRKLLGGAKFDDKLARCLSDLLYRAGRHHEGLDVCKEVLAKCPPTAQAWYDRGLHEYELKWYSQSKASLEEARKLAPQDRSVNDMLTQVSAMLGQGSNSTIKKPLAAVALPEAWLRLKPPGDQDAYLAGQHAWYELRATALEYKDGTGFRATEYRRVRIRDAEGVDAFSAFQFKFDPLSEEIYVNRLEVVDQAGKVAAAGKVDDYYVMDDHASGMASFDKLLNIPVPGLRPGCCIELEVTRVTNVKRMQFFRRDAISGFPALFSGLSVSGDTGSLSAECTGGFTALEAGGRKLFAIEKPPIFRWEAFAADPDEFMPMVQLAHKDATWAAEARTYMDELKPRLELDSAVKILAADLTTGLTEKEAKFRALARHVQKEIAYKAIEFGRRGWIPNAPGTILQNRYGDCKDHALLLHHLLKAAGIESHLTLVHSSNPVREKLPSVDQFNHMILQVRGLGSDRYVDLTDKNLEQGMAVGNGMAGRKALVLNPVEPALVTIPGYPDGSCSIKVERVARLAEDGTLAVEEKVAYGGYYAGYQRGVWRETKPDRRIEELQNRLSSIRGAVARKMEVEQLDDPALPLVLRTKYEVPRAFQVTGGHLAGIIPQHWETSNLSAGFAANRISPYQIEFPISIQTTSEFHAPAGWKVEPPVPAEGQSPQKSLSWRQKAAFTAGKHVLQFEAAFKPGIYPAAEYPAFKQCMDAAQAAIEYRLVLKKE